MNKKALFLILLLGVLIFPFFAQADLLGMVNTLVGNLTPLAGGLATIAFIVSGIMFLSATGNPSRMTVAKGALVAAIIGIIIVLLASNACEFVKALFGAEGQCAG